MTPLISWIRLLVINNQIFFPPPIREVLHLTVLSSKYLIYFYCVSLVLFWVYRFGNAFIPAAQKNALKLVTITGLIFYLFNLVLLKIESAHYPNYLYSVSGSSSELIAFLNQITAVTLGMIGFIFLQGGRFLSEVNHDFNRQRFARVSSIIKVGITATFIFAFTQSFHPISTFRVAQFESQLSYDQKFGSDFAVIEAVREFVPRDGFVIHPPQSGVWPFIGNQPMIRYFLFPRKLIGALFLHKSTSLKEFSPAYFAQFNVGKASGEWPLFATNSASISFDVQTYIPYQQLEKIGQTQEVTIYKIFWYE